MKKVLFILLVATMLMLSVACSPAENAAGEQESPGAAADTAATPEATSEPTPTPTPTPHPSYIDPELTAQDLIAQMGVGWNLGNTFDAESGPGTRLTSELPNTETFWLGGVEYVTTQTLIQTVKNAGFDTIRIPVTWQKAADPEDDWKIREDWLERVKEVVDWALEEDMFVIVNAHHENKALQLGVDGADSSEHPGRIFIECIWKQIAETFIDYDERLIFEGMNEPRHEGGENEWWGATQEVRDSINALNQAFVDTVRATGGSNQHRILMFTTHAAGLSPDGTRDVTLPDDPGNSVNKLVLSIHTYSPFDWAHEGNGTYGGIDDMLWDLNTAKQTGDRLGVPVILGEWGSDYPSRGDDADQETRDAQRPIHAEDFVSGAIERGMVPIWWDNGGFTGNSHLWGIIRRDYPHEISELNQQIIDAIMAGAGK